MHHHRAFWPHDSMQQRFIRLIRPSLECLARPRVEGERIAVFSDQAVLEAELGADVVVHPPAGRERVVGEPVCAAALIPGFALG